MNVQQTDLTIRKTGVVAATPEKAFQIFTEGIADWFPYETHSVEGMMGEDRSPETVVFETGPERPHLRADDERQGGALGARHGLGAADPRRPRLAGQPGHARPDGDRDAFHAGRRGHAVRLRAPRLGRARRRSRGVREQLRQRLGTTFSGVTSRRSRKGGPGRPGPLYPARRYRSATTIVIAITIAATVFGMISARLSAAIP